MQRLALGRVLHQNQSLIRLFSNAESRFNVSEPPSDGSVKSLEERQGAPDLELSSGGRSVPRASSLGEISIPRVMRRTPRIQIKPDAAPAKNPQSNLDYLSKPNSLDFASRLAKRQLEMASSNQGQTLKPLEIDPTLQRRLDGRKRAKQEGAAMERFVSRTLASRAVSGPNQIRDNQRQGVDGQRPRRASDDSYHLNDGRGVNTRHESQSRDVSQRPSDAHKWTHRDARRTRDQLPKASTPEQPSSSEKRSDKHAFVHSLGFSERPIDLHLLFGGEVTNQNTPSSASKRPSEKTPAEDMLEEAGGDYSRFLPPRLVETNGTMDPVGYAHLTLARRKDVGIRARSKILKIVKASAGGNKARA